jgi:peptidoglycan/LPS O-acetylase OafA/YrhL
MTPKIQSIINSLTPNSKRIFLIDSLGALLSAFFLGVILVKSEDRFGMPRTTLYALSSVACLFMIYSLCCYFFNFSNWKPYLKTIIIANSIYCCLTIGLIFYSYKSLTILGLIYFILELIVLIVLVFVERSVLDKNFGN